MLNIQALRAGGAALPSSACSPSGHLQLLSFPDLHDVRSVDFFFFFWSKFQLGQTVQIPQAARICPMVTPLPDHTLGYHHSPGDRLQGHCRAYRAMPGPAARTSDRGTGT